MCWHDHCLAKKRVSCYSHDADEREEKNTMTNVKELRTVEGTGPDKLNPQAVSSPVPATSSNPTLRQSTLSREIRGQHDALLLAIHRLEAALAAARRWMAIS